MRTLQRKPACFLVAALALLAGAGLARAGDEPYTTAWKIASAGVWPPALAHDLVVLKSGNTVAAHRVGSGEQAWKTTLPNLRYGTGVLAAQDKFVYVLAASGMHVLDAATGKPLRLRGMEGAISVLARDDSVYLAGTEGLVRATADGRKTLGRAKGITGELRDAYDKYVSVFTNTQSGPARERGKRLEVVDLSTGKRVYRFKLITEGDHRVIGMDRDKVVFIDHTRRAGGTGPNKRKLYYTETDYVNARKLRDVNLSGNYGEAAADTFWVAAGPAGQVFAAGHGEPGVASTLLAYDPVAGRLLWSKSGEVASMGILLHRGQLWTGVTAKDGGSRVVVYRPDDGRALREYALDAPGAGKPVAVGDRVLVRTRDSVYCFAPGVAAETSPGPAAKDGDPGRNGDDAVSPAGGDDVKVATLGVPAPIAGRPGWTRLSDSGLGFSVDLPPGWILERDKVLRMGGVRMVIPLMRKGKGRRGDRYVGAVQVLTWEDAGRDADGLWRSVYAQRKRLNPRVKVVSVNRVGNVGGSGQGGIRAVYRFGAGRRQTELRSLCVVSHGVAFELRGWATPRSRRDPWRQVEEVLASFKPIPAR